MLPLSPESPNFSYQNSELGIRNNLTGGCLFLKSSRPSHRFQLPWLLRSTVLQFCSPAVSRWKGHSGLRRLREVFIRRIILSGRVVKSSRQCLTCGEIKGDVLADLFSIPTIYKLLIVLQNWKIASLI